MDGRVSNITIVSRTIATIDYALNVSVRVSTCKGRMFLKWTIKLMLRTRLDWTGLRTLSLERQTCCDENRTCSRVRHSAHIIVSSENTYPVDECKCGINQSGIQSRAKQPSV
jgi:hypothetical protein